MIDILSISYRNCAQGLTDNNSVLFQRLLSHQPLPEQMLIKFYGAIWHSERPMMFKQQRKTFPAVWWQVDIRFSNQVGAHGSHH